MLVEKKKYEVGQVVSIKIANGDEIIAKLVSEDDDGFVLSRPMALIPSQNGMMMVAALISVDSKDDIRLEKRHIMLHGPTKENIADGYREQTTGIQAVRKSGIITG